MRNTPGSTPAGRFASTRTEPTRAAVADLLDGAVFAGSPRSGRLFEYLVERTLAGEGDGVNEYAIGLDVFDKPPGFDPRNDSTVRTGVTRLRQRLRAHYEGPGQRDAVRFEIPARSYRVVTTFAETRPVQKGASGYRFRVARQAIAAAAILLAATIAAMPARHALGVDSLVVLPFRESGPGDFSRFADGVTDELTSDLANVDGLRVVARTSAYQFAGDRPALGVIGHALGVEGVLEGNLEREAAGRIRARVRLSRASDGDVLWTRSYDLQARDPMAAQAQISRDITRDLRKVLASGSDAATAIRYNGY